MSVDAQLAHACPHYLRYERVGVTGGREILPASPISGVGLLDLRLDGVTLPSEGLRSSAEVVFLGKAPYKITATSNTLVVSSESTEIEIELTAKIYSQKEIVAEIAKKLVAPFSVEGYSGSVKISGGGQTNKLTLRGSMLSRLGFKGTSITRTSRVLVPAWRLARDAARNGSKLVFQSEYTPTGLLDISYTTERSYCRRCGGTGVENDFRFAPSGDLALVAGHDLLYQSVAKILLTQYRSNPYHTWYGSTAISLIGKKSSAGTAVALKDSVRNALDTLINTQGQQAKVQSVSLEERLKRVVSVDISSIGGDQTAYLVNVVVESMSSMPVSINIVFAVPGSISLDGELA